MNQEVLETLYFHMNHFQDETLITFMNRIGFENRQHNINQNSGENQIAYMNFGIF